MGTICCNFCSFYGVCEQQQQQQYFTEDPPILVLNETYSSM